MFFGFFAFFSCGNSPAVIIKEDSEDVVLMSQEFFEDPNSKSPPPPPPPPPSTKENSANKRISEELNKAHYKTDCMIEYLKKKDLETIDKTYEEYCK